jgi:ubiquinone/menaquinone biosynthesis C-methylase UbiE
MKFTGERMIPEANQKEDIYFEHYNRYIFAQQFVKGKDILDIASGSGYGTNLLKTNGGAKTALGVDISQEAVEHSNKKFGKSGLKFIQGEASGIPLKDSSVDVVISFETIEHMSESDQGKFIKEIKRVMRPSGLLVMSTPNPVRTLAPNPYHLNELSKKEYEYLIFKQFKYNRMLVQDFVTSNYIIDEDKNAEVVTKSGLLTVSPNWIETPPAYYISLSSDKIIDEKDVNLSAYLARDFYQEGLAKTEKEHRKVVNDLTQRLDESNAQIHSLGQKLAAIENSRVWKARNYISAHLKKKNIKDK